MYRNQYVVSANAELKTNIKPVRWQGLFIYPGPSLNIIQSSFKEYISTKGINGGNKLMRY